MADKTINDLTQAESIGSEDLFVLQQNSEAKKLRGAQLVKYAQDAVGAQVTVATQAAENAAAAKTGAESAQTQAQAARDAILNMIVEAITLETGQSATVSKSLVDGVVKLIFGLPAGSKGDKGDAFTYADFTPEQLAALKGEKGDAFVYEDFTPEQLESLRGPAGSSIESITRTAGTGAPGTTDTYTVTLTDGRTTTFNVYNGKDGEGAGDMLAATYDPQGKARDIFAYVDEMLGSAGAQVAKATMPKGRMKGDINGDGEVSFDDLRLSSMYVSGSVTLDELQIWCGDVNNDGAIKSFDNTHLRRLIAGDPASPSNFTKTPTMADYYGNWTYVKVDDMTGYFYTDIAVEGLTATSSAIVAVQGDHKRDAFAGAECMDGVIRIKANLLPLADTVCLVFYGSGDGTAVVVPENVVDRVDTAMSMRLASSTANSTKIFNITVDDSGVITATEVTT